MINSENFTTQYRLKAFFVFGVAMIILLNRFFAHALFSGMNEPLFLFQEKEWMYQLFLRSNIAQWITDHKFIAIAFDVLFFATPVLFLITLRKELAIVFSFLLLIYFFTYNLVTGHHYHGLVAAIIISIPFWTKQEDSFNLLWQGARYYWLYIFASAGLWKLFRGTVFYTDQLSNILKSQQLDLLLQQPNSFHAQVVQYLIAHPDVSHAMLVLNVLVQLCFVIGFFTKRYDALLFVLAIVFCIANYFVMSIVSAELLILNLSLLNWEKVRSIVGVFTNNGELV